MYNRLSITVDTPEFDKAVAGIKIHMMRKSIGLVSGPDMDIFELKKPRNRPKTNELFRLKKYDREYQRTQHNNDFQRRW